MAMKKEICDSKNIYLKFPHSFLRNERDIIWLVSKRMVWESMIKGVIAV